MILIQSYICKLTSLCSFRNLLYVRSYRYRGYDFPYLPDIKLIPYVYILFDIKLQYLIKKM